jgi:hypothetical protein
MSDIHFLHVLACRFIKARTTNVSAAIINKFGSGLTILKKQLLVDYENDHFIVH